MLTFLDYLKQKEIIQKKAQKIHDEALKEYQTKQRDFGYINFIDPRTNKRWRKVFLLADFDKIDRNLVPIIRDNRK